MKISLTVVVAKIALLLSLTHPSAAASAEIKIFRVPALRDLC